MLRDTGYIGYKLAEIPINNPYKYKNILIYANKNVILKSLRDK